MNELFIVLIKGTAIATNSTKRAIKAKVFLLPSAAAIAKGVAPVPAGGADEAAIVACWAPKKSRAGVKKGSTISAILPTLFISSSIIPNFSSNCWIFINEASNPLLIPSNLFFVSV